MEGGEAGDDTGGKGLELELATVQGLESLIRSLSYLSRGWYLTGLITTRRGEARQRVWEGKERKGTTVVNWKYTLLETMINKIVVSD